MALSPPSPPLTAEHDSVLVGVVTFVNGSVVVGVAVSAGVGVSVAAGGVEHVLSHIGHGVVAGGNRIL
jgi:hypothetical protein